MVSKQDQRFELGYRNMVTLTMSLAQSQTCKKTPEQRILELEQQVRLLEKQKTRAEYLANRADKKAVLFDMMIDIAKEEFNIPIRKKSVPKLSKDIVKKNKKK